jgi:hypothetical protein
MKDNDNLSQFWFVVSNALPPVGFFLYFKHRMQYPNKAKRALVSALIGIPAGILAGYVLNNYIL